MDKRCYDLLDIPNLDGIELVAGKGGLSNVIYWVHVAEAATTVEELFEWLKPDDFLVIVGNFLKDNSNALYEITKEAIKNRLSGILIYKNIYCEYPPKYMIEMADANNLPIFFLPNHNTSVLEFSYHLTRMIMQDIDTDDFTEKIIKDVYYSNYENPDMKIKRAEKLGYQLNCPHCGISIDICNKDSQIHEPLSEENISLCIEVMKNALNKKPLYYYDGTVLFALIPVSDLESNALKAMSQKIIDKYIKRYPKSTVSIGIGDTKRNVSDFKDSINESMEIIRIMKLIHASNTVKMYSEMLSHILIYQMKDAPIAQKLYHSTFDPLISYDRSHNCNLVEVLREYIHSDCNITLATSNLYLHRNTVIYRLNKIEELTGKNLKDQEAIFQFMMGFYLEDLLTEKALK